ncbi:warm temperature acclimation-related 65 kDa [Solea senegalensis]|uniref:Hemopexin n=1 Tax=Solea senegalensis TaxID=28829 RepID=A0AAV6RHG4_SOLSE|nr:hemopexin [Solea senegalensis]KAG7503431.1 warm temperature acclimation-related 65 kDa [Solea senegalensis]
MKLLTHVLCLCLALALACADSHETHASDIPDHCHGLEMDAVAVDEDGVPYFFKGDHLLKGFHGKPELFNETFAELDDHHHLSHVDAAFLMHYEESHDHDHMFFFLDEKVYSYQKHKLEDGYPKNITEVFPGIPDHLDAAIGCPKADCGEDSVIFFKEHEIYHYNVKTKAVEEKEFKTMPNCTAAFRFLGHYYCFHGHLFSKFDPKTGDVHGKYPKEVRDYFMRCANYSSHSDDVEREQCSRVHLDAITSDHDGNMYAFRGHYFISRDAGNATLKADSIENVFKELHSEVDAVFTYEDQLHMIKDDHLFVYKVGGEHPVLMEGYPKSVKEELGVEGHIDAAFICEDHHIAHIVKGDHVYDVEMKASPRVINSEQPIALFKTIDAAKCDKDGIKVIVGNHYYTFESLKVLATGRALPEQHRVSQDLFGCDH